VVRASAERDARRIGARGRHRGTECQPARRGRPRSARLVGDQQGRPLIAGSRRNLLPTELRTTSAIKCESKTESSGQGFRRLSTGYRRCVPLCHLETLSWPRDGSFASKCPPQSIDVALYTGAPARLPKPSNNCQRWRKLSSRARCTGLPYANSPASPVSKTSEWIDLARGKSVRQLEELVAGKRHGDDPASPHQPNAQRHVLRFEVASGDVRTVSRGPDRTPAEHRRRAGRRRCAAPDGPPRTRRAARRGTSRLSDCTQCVRGVRPRQQSASGEFVPLGPEIVAMAQCDCQQIPLPACHDSPLGGALANDNHRSDTNLHTAEAAGCAHASASVPPGDHPDASSPQSAHLSAGARRAVTTRATQTIPPALRRAILLRDQRRCRVPGVRNAHFLDVHHIQLRSESGQHEPQNLLTLCSVHHRASHRGQLLIEGGATTGLRFSHADGVPTAKPQNPGRSKYRPRRLGPCARSAFVRARSAPYWRGCGTKAI
jgi:hypothetical protein